MANRTFYPAFSSGVEVVYAEFELLGAGAAALTLNSDAPYVLASVSRSTTGTYLLTFKDAWSRVVYKSADIDDTLNDGTYATVGNLLNEGTSTPLQATMYIRAAAGTLVDPAAGRRIGCSFRFRNGLGWGQR